LVQGLACFHPVALKTRRFRQEHTAPSTTATTAAIIIRNQIRNQGILQSKAAGQSVSAPGGRSNPYPVGMVAA
jgi:hypothetical protein